MIQTVVRVPEAGFYTFGFNSDDGFLTTLGNDKLDTIKLGEFNGGRGAATTSYSVYFESPGDYAMQSLWYEGGGDANLEWFTIEPDMALLNDTANGGLQTFAVLPNVSATISHVSPAPDSQNVDPMAGIELVIEDGSGSVDTSTIQVRIDDVLVSANTQKSEGRTTVQVAGPQTMRVSGQVVPAQVIYSSGGNSAKLLGIGKLRTMSHLEKVKHPGLRRGTWF